VFGLSESEWRDLVLSVNVHRKDRRLSPVQAGIYMKRALEVTDVEALAEALNFEDTTTMRKILRLADLPSELTPTIDWGTRKGSVSMSTAAELMRLDSEELVRTAIKAAVEHSITKEEARQIVQIRERSGDPIQQCINGALKTRPRIERHEMIIGSLLSKDARDRSEKLGGEVLSKKLKIALAREFPNVICRALRVSGDRFSLLFAEEEAKKFRSKLAGESIESMVTRLAGTIELD